MLAHTTYMVFTLTPPVPWSFAVSCTQRSLRIKSDIMSETHGPLPTCLINDILPVEMFGSIFEEHAKLEWRAPAIDGRVCRLWRQVVLNTPRAWAYPEVHSHDRPTISELRLWLHRSGTALLHIRVDYNIPLLGPNNTPLLYNLLSDYHARIASLDIVNAPLSFLVRKAFPRMQFLDVRRWDSYPYSTLPPIQWGPMPQLRSLRLGPTSFCVAPLDGVAPLKVLTLHRVNCTPLPRHTLSLTKLMLEEVSLDGIISGPLAFPSLTLLSLFNVTGLKRHIEAPYLSTYHDGGRSIGESFSAPLQSLVEYGIYNADPSRLEPNGLDPTVWNYYFPNVSRLSMRVPLDTLESLLDAIFGDTHLLPALKVISVRNMSLIPLIEGQKIMESRLRRQDKACRTGVVLYIEYRLPDPIPLFFARVSRTLLGDL